eukprot:XP_001699895.1 predicted protein [Chlamydomonas reinhardtii]
MPVTPHCLLARGPAGGGGGGVYEQVHVYNREVAGAGLREEDGLFEERAQLRRGSGPLEPPLLLAVGPDAAVSVRSLQLPPVALGGGQQAAAAAAADGPCRWSLVLLYSTHTGALAKVTFVQEYDTRADPATPHVLAEAVTSGAVQPPRPPLKRHFAPTWVPRGTLGKVTARVWAAEGKAAAAAAPAAAAAAGGGGLGLLVDEAVAGEYAEWAAASSLSPSSLLVLPLPDSMYLRAPASLKDLRQQQQQQAAVARVVAAFEFGGLLRSVEGGLQRVVVRYDAAAADGGFVEATREVFVRGNKFEKLAGASRSSNSTGSA